MGPPSLALSQGNAIIGCSEFTVQTIFRREVVRASEWFDHDMVSIDLTALAIGAILGYIFRWITDRRFL